MITVKYDVIPLLPKLFNIVIKNITIIYDI